MDNFNTKRQALVHHASRIEGQLRAIRRELENHSPDCEKASTLLCATSRSFASLRKSFVQCFLEQYYDNKRLSPKKREVYSSLFNVISS